MSCATGRLFGSVPALRLLVTKAVGNAPWTIYTPTSRRLQLQMTKFAAVNSSFYRNYSSREADPYIIKSPRPAVTIPDLALHDFVWQKIGGWEDKIAVECGVTQRKYTYREARKVSKKLASALQKQFNLQKDDCFAVLLPNIPEYPFFLLAASEAGLVATTINPIYKPYEIAKQMKDCNAKLLVTIPALVSNANEALKELKSENTPIIVVKDSPKSEIPKGTVSFDEVIQNSSGDVKSYPVNIEDTVVLPYSSGTTGLPKGVQLSHRNVTANLIQMNVPGVRLMLQTTATQQDVVLGLLPMFHIYGMVVVALTCLAEGGKMVTLPRFEPKLFIDTLVNYKAALLYLVPPLILFLGGHPDVKPEYLASIRDINSGAAPIGLTDIERLQKKAPHIMMIQGYGMTESSPVTFITCRERKEKYASIGVPVSNTDAKVVDVTTGKSLPVGQSGELLVRGPQVMKGYLNRDDANAETLVDGWLRTGDLVHYDEEGDFFVTDRLKELIKVKGFQVAPAELEALLRLHPKVSDAAVIGVADERSGEVPRGFVVAKPGQTIDPKDVADFVADKVAEYKQLTGGVVVLPAIPKSAAGKILRKELKLKFGESK